jgi:phosphoribosylamine--glycine ligase
MHTENGLKILENNSRPGDPEIINILPVLKDDFVDICFKMIEGNLTKIELVKAATVVTYKVPPSYGGYDEALPTAFDKNEVGKPVDLSKAYGLHREFGNDIRIYPGSMEKRNGDVFSLKSRAICAVGIADTVEAAREISVKGLVAIRGGALWYRTDVASESHIRKSRKHLRKLRRES